MKRWMTGIIALAATLTVGLFWTLQPPRLQAPDRRSWSFEDVTLVEPGRDPRASRTLRIEDGVIAAIEATPTRGNETLARSDTRDLSGLYIAAGLSDLHAHYPIRRGSRLATHASGPLLLLSHGVTSIRETGSIFAVRESIRERGFPGPRIFAWGAMLDGEPRAFPRTAY